MDMFKYLQQLTILGLSNNTMAVSATHPPGIPYCLNTTSVELKGWVNWLECAHPLPLEHNTTGWPQIVYDWSHCLVAHKDWMTPGRYVALLMTIPKGHIQKNLWRAFAVLDFVNLSDSSTAELDIKHSHGV